MADMHRPGRIGRDIFDIDLAVPSPRRRAADIERRTSRRARRASRARTPDAGRILMKPGPATSAEAIRVGLADRCGESFRPARAALCSGTLASTMRGIGRQVAVAGVARRLDGDARQGQAARLVLLFQFERLQRTFRSAR